MYVYIYIWSRVPWVKKISDLARNAQEKAKQEAEGPENSGQKTSKLM